MTAKAKQGPGRPALPPDQVMHMRHMRSTDADHDAQCAAAEAKGQTWSQWARDVLRRAAARSAK